MSLFLQWLARRWVAGERIESAVLAAKSANSQCLGALLNYMGEHHHNRALVEQAAGMYRELVKCISKEHLDAGISLKLTQLGLDIGKGYCLRQLMDVVRRAKRCGVTVWLDMEAPHTVQDTIDIYLDVFSVYWNLGITIQANLKRSRADVLRILGKKGRVRLVRGAYRGDIGGWEEVEDSFSRLLRLLFARSGKFAIATNDRSLLEEAQLLQTRYQRQIEFQFLRGVNRKLKLELATEYQVADYIPFGRQVAAYAWRRLRERPGVVFELFR